MDPQKSLFSRFGLNDVAQCRWSTALEEAQQIRYHQINTPDVVECMFAVGFPKYSVV